MIDVAGDPFLAVRSAVERALDESFRAIARTATNPYGDGHAAPRIAACWLPQDALDRLLRKRFVTLEQP